MHTHARTHTCTHTHMHVHMHTHTHTYTHTHTHTHEFMFMLLSGTVPLVGPSDGTFKKQQTKGGKWKFCTSPSFTFVSQSRPLVISLIDIDNTIFNQDPQVVQFPIVGCNMSWERQVCTGNDNNNNNILYSSQWEIKAVVQSYTLTCNKHLYCTYLNNSKS